MLSSFKLFYLKIKYLYFNELMLRLAKKHISLGSESAR